MEISYTTEISKPYVAGVQSCATVDELKKFLYEWKELAPDALSAVQAPTFSWDEYQKMCRMERRGKYAGDEMAEKYGAILMPGVIMFIGLQADAFKVPEGLMFMRLRDAKAIRFHVDGYYYLDECWLEKHNDSPTK